MITKFKSHRAAAQAGISEAFLRRMSSKGHAANIAFTSATDDNGEVVKNDEEGEIVIKVIPDALQTGKGDRSVTDFGLDVTALSGGEKSLTSLILLSAIAGVSGPPFRVIDEFDVFQDEATRKKSIAYLLECVERARAPSPPAAAARALTLARPPAGTRGRSATTAR